MTFTFSYFMLILIQGLGSPDYPHEQLSARSRADQYFVELKFSFYLKRVFFFTESSYIQKTEDTFLSLF